MTQCLEYPQLSHSRLLISITLALLLLKPAGTALAGQMGAGTQGRDWIDGEPTVPTSPERYVVRVADNVRVEMRDGVELVGRLFEPSRSGEPGACILVANGYGASTGAGAVLDPWLFDLASRGYAVLHMSLRGSGESGGTGDLYASYGEDGYDLIEWMAGQPWCNGSVGMVGASLLGISQWLTAKEAPPHLRAIAPEIACGDCYGVLWYPGGMLPGPGREARRMLPGVTTEYDSAVTHRDFDEWWRGRMTLPEDHAAMAARGLAVLIRGGFQDYLTPASLRAYREYGGPDAAKRLIVGPWPHAMGEPFTRELVVRFLDENLRGVNPEPDTARVLLHLEGPDRWRRELDWPLPDESRVKLFLSWEPSGSIDSVNDGSLSHDRPVQDATAEVNYTPDNGPFLPTHLDINGRPGLNQTPWAERLPSWTTAPLSAPTEITGNPQLVLWVAASNADADLVAAVSDVAPDGSSRLVTQGYLNLPRTDPTRPRPLEPGVVVRYQLELSPLAYVFSAGHRIRLSIAGGATPTADQIMPQGPGKHPGVFGLTVHSRGSSLELPLIGTAAAPFTGTGR